MSTYIHEATLFANINANTLKVTEALIMSDKYPTSRTFDEVWAPLLTCGSADSYAVAHQQLLLELAQMGRNNPIKRIWRTVGRK